jgi:transcriptional regulator with XRE-family HTH domain
MGLASPIGEQVARLRMLRGLTQEGLAARSGVSVDVIRRLEQGARASARLSSLARLAEAMDVELSLLLAGPVMLAGAASGEDSPAGMLELRRALTPADVLDGLAPEAETDTGEASLGVLRSSARQAWQAYQAGDYSGVAVSLPGLIAELRHAPRGRSPGGTRSRSSRWSVRRCAPGGAWPRGSPTPAVEGNSGYREPQLCAALH